MLCAVAHTRDSPVPRRCEENPFQRPPDSTREKEVSLQKRSGSQNQDEEGVVGSWLFPGCSFFSPGGLIQPVPEVMLLLSSSSL